MKLLPPVLAPILLWALPALADHSARHMLETVVVTSTREAKPKREVPESIAVQDRTEIENVAPSHPSELLNRIPGVHVNNLGGEGHMTSIRQPLTTAGVYLLLEDGIPTRPTGYFNHNGLYEVNIPQADGLELTRGPGSALYGSDAIGGIINTLSAAPPNTGTEVKADVEGGSHGWKRGLLSAGANYAPGAGVLLNFNATDSEGYREHSGYERQSATLRWDTPVTGNTKAKTIVAWNDIDQTGVSGLFASDYRHDPEQNYYAGDIARREVYALRASSELATTLNDRELLTFTPFYRDNRMDLMPSWMLSFDPQQYTTTFRSYGLLTRYRLDLPGIGGQFIVGVDMDSTPSDYEEDQLLMTKTGNEYLGYFYTGRRNYDFDATQNSISPYGHVEWQAADKLRASLGLRYDWFEVDYNDKLDATVPEVIGFRRWYRPDDQSNTYQQISPKAGLIYAFNEQQDIYANYRHAFRVPTAGQLFRSGSSLNSEDLDPVRSDSMEIGTRGTLVKWLNYELAIYHMETKDDIVNYVASGTRFIANAGETEHEGIEIGIGGNFTQEWGFTIAWTRTEQTYEDFSAVCGAASCNYKGNDIMQAPETIGNATLSYEPSLLRGLRLEAELEHLGEYYVDQTNTASYHGHNLYNLRARYLVDAHLEWYGRVQNITDRRYSTATSLDPVNGVEYRPGLPLSAYLGVRYNL